MGSIYITGDIHLGIDIYSLNEDNFPKQKELTKNDYVIITGDASLTWDETLETKQWVDWLDNRNFTTLFCCGNHENFDILNKLPIEKFNGGKVHRVTKSIYHLMRGETFDLHGEIFFVMGGAFSLDKFCREEGKTYWKEELPSFSELKHGKNNLKLLNNTVDYIITHDCSRRIARKIDSYKASMETFEDELLKDFFDYLTYKVKYKHWFFGHHHIDMQVNLRHTAVFNKVIKLK